MRVPNDTLKFIALGAEPANWSGRDPNTHQLWCWNPGEGTADGEQEGTSSQRGCSGLLQASSLGLRPYYSQWAGEWQSCYHRGTVWSWFLKLTCLHNWALPQNNTVLLEVKRKPALLFPRYSDGPSTVPLCESGVWGQNMEGWYLPS